MARRRAEIAKPVRGAPAPAGTHAAPNPTSGAAAATRRKIVATKDLGEDAETNKIGEDAEANKLGGDAPARDLAEGAATVGLPANLGFAAARELHGTLLGLRGRRGVVLDASKVERMSTAAVLVIVSFLNARTEIIPPASVTGASGAFVDAFSEIGLFASLMRMEFLA